MDSPGGYTSFKQTNAFGKISSVNSSQLDKIDAVPSRANISSVLVEGLCQEDRIYLNSLFENSDSSDDEDEDSQMTSSAWSPMMQSPVMMNKRIKLLKTNYAVTLSLEDISYIRPSWGLSKGIKRIEIQKKKRKRRASVTSASSISIDTDSCSSKAKEMKATERLSYYLILLVVAVVILMLPPFLVDRHRSLVRIDNNRLSVDVSERYVEFYRLGADNLVPIFKIRYGLNIPLDLKPESCDCDLFDSDLDQNSHGFECFSCLDWAFRANMRIYVEKRADYSAQDEFCYHIKWQNYNTLFGPLVDCFGFEDENWYGLGDIQDPSWPFSRTDFDWRSLKTNLTGEFEATANNSEAYENTFGSYVNLTLISGNRVSVGKLRTDFEILAKLSRDSITGGRQMCLSATCTDKCSETWQRDDHLDRLRLKNNFFEYTVCSGRSLKSLVSRHLYSSTTELSKQVFERSQTRSVISSSNINETIGQTQFLGNASSVSIRNDSSEPRIVPEGIGLIDRLIFATSMEYFPILNGQTIREYVDKIVDLNLKSSIILSIDTRWQTYVGSFKLNSDFFPKARLLLEILHHRGFKIIFTIRPYLDTAIGLNTVDDLLGANKLYPTSFVDHRLLRKSDPRAIEELSLHPGGFEVISRRESLFKRRNVTIRIRSKTSEKFPLLFRCKESKVGYCGLFDLTKPKNRAEMITTIKKIELLSLGADGIRLAGTHPIGYSWQDHYRESLSELTKDLFYKERLYTIPQYTGDFGYIELAPRPFLWRSLKSILNSVFNLGMMSFSLIHPGSVWGDIKQTHEDFSKSPALSPESHANLGVLDSVFGPESNSEKSEEELAIRWLQLAVFLPILQFNNLDIIGKFGLHEQMRDLIKIRKVFVVPELKKHLPYTPLISQSKQNLTGNRWRTVEPLIRPVWLNQENRDTMIPEQFMIGPDILVAPILSDAQRQRDIYLPSGSWRDELRQASLRGGKWLRNYRIELNEVAWFTRDKR